MDLIETLRQRNQDYSENGFVAGMKMMPSLRTLIVGCLDPRVDPMDILKLEPGDAAIVRNVGGRVGPAFFETVGMLRALSRSRGNELGPGWNVVVLHHTDCGINGCVHEAPDLVAQYMGVAEKDLERLAITDPYKSVEVDVAALRARDDFPASATVTGMVYDVATGKVEVIVPPTQARSTL